MWMGLQESTGKQATHDFLSLCSNDSSFPIQDSMPPSQGFFLKTHDFLKPLEKAEELEAARQAGPTAELAGGRGEATVARVLPGGIGTYSISHVSDNVSAAAVKPVVVTCTRGSLGLVGKPEPDNGSAGSGYGYGSGPYAGVALTLWDSSSAAASDNAARCRWPSPFAARATASFGSLSSSRNHPAAQDKKRLMESGSRCSRGFDDGEEEEEEDDELGRREGTSRKVELTVKVDRKGRNDQKETTPRSKHSATEQRRRSKINDRFQILRELIPRCDQKRDKASFLLEAIEYIQFLQEKIQKYEASYPGWSDENAKLMPWVKAYFRSFWKNERSNKQIPGDGRAEPSQDIKIDHAQGFIYSADDIRLPSAPGLVSAAQNPIESEMSPSVSYKPMENHVGFTSKASSVPVPSQPNYASVEGGAGVAQPPQRLISDIDNMAAQSQSQWLRPSGPLDYCVSSDLLSEQEELTIGDGMINLSTAYSQNILNTLNQALESSGVDLSQANISVQINLGKRATRRATATTMSSAKELDVPVSGRRPVIRHSRVGSSGEEYEQVPKRQKSENS